MWSFLQAIFLFTNLQIPLYSLKNIKYTKWINIRKNYIQQFWKKYATYHLFFSWRSTNSSGCYILNLIVCALKLEPSPSYLQWQFVLLMACLEQINHSLINKFVNEGIKHISLIFSKWMSVYISRSIYVIKAVKALQVLYPNLTNLWHAELTE